MSFGKFFSDKNINKVNEIEKSNKDVVIRKFNIDCKKGYLLYISSLSDRNKISEYIIKPILNHNYSEKTLNIDYLCDSVIYIDDISVDSDENKIINYLVEGNSVVIMESEEKYIVADTYKVEKRSVQTPELQNVLRGPRDSFTENYETNISLIRYRIKDPNLNVDKMSVGDSSKTTVGIVYLSNKVNKNLVNYTKNKLNSVQIDGVLEAAYIQKILNDKKTLFPKIGISERSDTIASAILGGKICIVVEGSNIVLVYPENFFEAMEAGEDHYENVYLSSFLKTLRIVVFGMSILLSPLYVAVVSFHPDILPASYILILASSRISVPFNSVLEITMLEIVAEILKESSLRLPKQIATTLGVVGAIVIGQAVVSAGLVSYLAVIIVALSTISSFISPDHTIMNPIRVLKFFMIFITGFLGLFGLTMGVTLIIITMCSNESFGESFMEPVAPFELRKVKDYFSNDIDYTIKNKRDNNKNS
ncbi:spore germination protein [Clostridium oceanicum]